MDRWRAMAWSAVDGLGWRNGSRQDPASMIDAQQKEDTQCKSEVLRVVCRWPRVKHCGQYGLWDVDGSFEGCCC